LEVTNEYVPAGASSAITRVQLTSNAPSGKRSGARPSHDALQSGADRRDNARRRSSVGDVVDVGEQQGQITVGQSPHA
jgi:hypothetical protein